MWRRGHVAEPTELSDADAAGYWAEVMDTGRAVDEAFEPMKLNDFTLGNTVPHLHTHVVPRFRKDPAPGGPIPWDAVVGARAFDEAELHRQAAALRATGRIS